MAQIVNDSRAPGTLIRDALAPEIMGDGSGGTKAITTTGAETGVDAHWPDECVAVMTIGAVTGTSVDVEVRVESSSVSDFASNVRSHGTFNSVDENDDNTTRRLPVVAPQRYIRANTVTAGGTSPSAALNVTLHYKDDLRVGGSSYTA